MRRQTITLSRAALSALCALGLGATASYGQVEELGKPEPAPAPPSLVFDDAESIEAEAPAAAPVAGLEAAPAGGAEPEQGWLDKLGEEASPERTTERILEEALSGIADAEASEAVGEGEGLPSVKDDIPELTPKEREERNRQISSNYDRTLSTYSEILERQETDPTALDRRIENNEQLLENYRPKVSKARGDLRASKVAFTNRVLDFKRQRDAGALTDEKFQARVLEEDTRYQRRRTRVVDDLDFFSQEAAEAEARLAVLREKRQQMESEIVIRRKNDPTPVDPTKALLEGMLGGLSGDLSGFRVRYTMDDVQGLRGYDHLHPVVVSEE